MDKLSLRDIQLAELDILKEFDGICKKYDLKYSLAGGSMLGAVRHKGFIPWDDDIDVCMPRPDYEKFKKIFADATDTNRFKLTSDTGRDAEYPFVKMLDKSFCVGEKGFREVKNLWIDILPVDGLPDSLKKSEKIMRRATLYRYIVLVNKWKKVSDFSGRHSRFKFVLARIYSKLYGEKRAVKKAVKHATRYDFNGAGFVGIIVWGCYGIGERIKKSGFDEMTEVEFEGLKFSAMSNYKEYLTGIYGDFMTLPPEDKRKIHCIDVYRQEQV